MTTKCEVVAAMDQAFADAVERHTEALLADAPPPTLWDLVVVDMKGRDDFGTRKYGRPLAPHDGRDTLRDAYEEALDLAVYLRKALHERDGR